MCLDFFRFLHSDLSTLESYPGPTLHLVISSTRAALGSDNFWDFRYFWWLRLFSGTLTRCFVGFFFVGISQRLSLWWDGLSLGRKTQRSVAAHIKCRSSPHELPTYKPFGCESCSLDPGSFSKVSSPFPFPALFRRAVSRVGLHVTRVRLLYTLLLESAEAIFIIKN